jgi:hypothetical protein
MRVLKVVPLSHRDCFVAALLAMTPGLLSLRAKRSNLDEAGLDEAGLDEAGLR